MPNSPYDVIVIGSGIGGLTVASLLARLRHQRVLVLERHFKLGGCTHIVEQPGGFRWEVGLRGPHGHRATVPHTDGLHHPEAGPVESDAAPFEKFVFPDFTFEVPVGEAAYRKTLIEWFPDERPAIEQYLADVHRAARWFRTFIIAQILPFPWDGIVRRVNRRSETRHSLQEEVA